MKLNVYVQQTNLKVSEIERQLGKTKKEFDNAAEAHEKAFNNCVQGSRFTSVRRRQNTLQEKEVLLKLWEAKLEEAVCISEIMIAKLLVYTFDRTFRIQRLHSGLY